SLWKYQAHPTMNAQMTTVSAAHCFQSFPSRPLGAFHQAITAAPSRETSTGAKSSSFPILSSGSSSDAPYIARKSPGIPIPMDNSATSKLNRLCAFASRELEIPVADEINDCM